METTIAVLAGGESTRMGQDKALLTVAGMPMLEQIVRTASMVTPNVIVVGRTRPANWPIPTVSFLCDTVSGEGPLRGLETVLQTVVGRSILLIGCDMPLITPDALRWIITEAEKSDTQTDGLVTVNNSQWEPLFSVYRPDCLTVARKALIDRRRSLHGLIKMGNFAFTDIPDGYKAQIVNVNTPHDYNMLTQLADSP